MTSLRFHQQHQKIEKSEKKQVKNKSNNVAHSLKVKSRVSYMGFVLAHNYVSMMVQQVAVDVLKHTSLISIVFL